MVWLDCDPGNDDMLAIVMAALSEELELIGISTSAGNSIIQNTTQNALDILYEIGRADIPVVRGSATPLCRKLESAAEYHGELGLEGAVLERSPFQAIADNPFLYLYNAIMGQLLNMRDGGFISAHDYKIGAMIAEIVAGGDVEQGSMVNEQWLLDRERKGFMELLNHPKTQERIMGMLQTGKPVRN